MSVKPGHAHELRITGSGLDEVIVDAETIEAIRQLALPETPPPESKEPLTVGEALDTIEARIRRRLEVSGHGVYVKLSERLERLRRHQIDRAQSSVEFLKELLDVARQLVAAENADDEGRLDRFALLPDPKLGALTQILDEYAPERTPEFVRNVVADIDAIVIQSRYTGWTTSQPGDREARRLLRDVLRKHGLPPVGPLFDRAYAYIRENY